eukprot:TRINITY_DN14912_c0_g1_i2.p1 TRINITY_DN14912_c0_g1~~TRINITY_DN14912_c0_g1_i2.p1  ORF type:complete len:276 (+),score=38.67 TRINITY_DN14912_c0_g1_i2:91-828(+)
MATASPGCALMATGMSEWEQLQLALQLSEEDLVNHQGPSHPVPEVPDFAQSIPLVPCPDWCTDLVIQGFPPSWGAAELMELCARAGKALLLRPLGPGAVLVHFDADSDVREAQQRLDNLPCPGRGGAYQLRAAYPGGPFPPPARSIERMIPAGAEPRLQAAYRAGLASLLHRPPLPAQPPPLQPIIAISVAQVVRARCALRERRRGRRGPELRSGGELGPDQRGGGGATAERCGWAVALFVALFR